MRRLDFKDHRRELGDNAYIYAVVSRRARGLSIGVNLNPDKACNFDCPYCQVDRTVPGGARKIDLPRLRDELEHLLGLVDRGELWHTAPFDTADPALRRVADIAFAGDGEPTTPPEFPEAARIVRECRDRLAPGVPIRLLTNSTMLHLPRVQAALADIDEPWCKLDAGTEAYFRVVDGTKFSFERILANLRDTAARRPIVIQSMFMTLDGVGPTDAEIESWVSRLLEIRPREVQVYSVARLPSDPRVAPLPSDRLAHIASCAREAGLVVSVA